MIWLIANLILLAFLVGCIVGWEMYQRWLLRELAKSKGALPARSAPADQNQEVGDV